MKKTFITLLLTFFTPFIQAEEISGKFLCKGTGVLQPNIVGDEPEPAEFEMIIDYDRSLIEDVIVSARLEYRILEQTIKYDEEKKVYRYYKQGHGYSSSIQIETVEENDPSKIRVYFGLQYHHYAAGYSSSEIFEYDTEPLTCSQI